MAASFSMSGGIGDKVDLYDPLRIKYQQWALSQTAPAQAEQAGESAALASALAPGYSSGSGAFGSLPPEALMGLTPEQVAQTAQQRTETEYKRILQASGALDFARKATGQDLKEEKDKINLQGGIQRDIAAMKEEGDMARANLAVKTSENNKNLDVKGIAYQRATKYLEWKQKATKNKDNKDWQTANPKPEITLADLEQTGLMKDFSDAQSTLNTLTTQRQSLIASGMSPQTIDIMQGLAATKMKNFVNDYGDILKDVGGQEITPEKKATGKTATDGKYKEFTDGKTTWFEDASGKRIN